MYLKEQLEKNFLYDFLWSKTSAFHYMFMVNKSFRLKKNRTVSKEAIWYKEETNNFEKNLYSLLNSIYVISSDKISKILKKFNNNIIDWTVLIFVLQINY